MKLYPVGCIEPDAPRRGLTRLRHEVPIGIQNTPSIGGKVVGENVPIV